MSRFLPDHPGARRALACAGFTLLTAVLLFVVFPGTPGAGRGTPMAVAFQGFMYGLVVSLFAVSIVLIYRTMRFINFAQGLIGSLGLNLLLHLLVFTDTPFLVAFPLGMVITVGLAAAVGVFMLRFLRSSRLFVTVVTIAGSLALGAGVNVLLPRLPFWPSPDERTSDQSRDLTGIVDDLPFRGFDFGVGDFDLRFGFEHLFVIELAVVTLLVLGAFLRFTRFGTAVRAMASNPERASLLGIGVGGLTVVVWLIVGVLDFVAAFGALAAAPDITGGQVSTGFSLLVPMFAAAVVGRFQNIPTTVFAAVMIGLYQFSWDFSFRDDRALFEAGLFAVIAGGLLLQRRGRDRSETGAAVTWAATTEPRPIPKELRGVGAVLVTRIVLITVGLLAVVVAPLVLSTGDTVVAGQIAVRAMAVLSLVVLTGWAGQVSLGQWALVAVGSVVGGSLTASLGLSFWLAIPVGIAITAAVAVVVGLPALRMQGLFLLVTTAAFALATRLTLFDERYFGWLLPDQAVDRPTLFFIDFDGEVAMYYLTVLALVLSIVVVVNLRRSRVGRMLIALRENEANVQSFGINVVRAKLLAFAIAGGIAGFAGVIFAHMERGVSPESFDLTENVFIFAAAVIGGVSSPGGALLGSGYFQLNEAYLSDNVLFGTFFELGGPLLLLFVAPGGFISIINAGRDSVLRVIAQRRRIVVPSLFADYDPDAMDRQLVPLGDPDLSSGLSALPTGERFSLASELYAGRGVRVVDRLGPKKEARDTVTLRAAAASAEEDTANGDRAAEPADARTDQAVPEEART